VKVVLPEDQKDEQVVLPSGADLTKLSGQEGTVLHPSKTDSEAWIVEIDSTPFEIDWNYLQVVEAE